MRKLQFFMHAVCCAYLLSIGNYYAAFWCALATAYMYAFLLADDAYSEVKGWYEEIIAMIQAAKLEGDRDATELRKSDE